MADPTSRSGTTYVTPAILDWLHGVHSPHDAALEQAFAAPERHAMPAIQVGPAEGRLLELLVRLAGARRVVEFGTLAGYSTIRLARGAGPEGRVWTCELDERHAEVARANLAAAGMADRVEVLVGAGLELLPRLAAHAPVDAVFIDADKGAYDQYGRWAAAHLRPGGLLLGDNAYLFGRLLEDSDEARAMRRFHTEAVEAFDTACIPTPDGLLVGIKR